MFGQAAAHLCGVVRLRCRLVSSDRGQRPVLLKRGVLLPVGGRLVLIPIKAKKVWPDLRPQAAGDTSRLHEAEQRAAVHRAVVAAKPCPRRVRYA